MNPRRAWTLPLRIAGFHMGLLALYHFVLPTHLGWDRLLGRTPNILVWALHALNAFWSLAALLAAGLILILSHPRHRKDPLARACVLGLALYWLGHGLYCAAHPFPLPPALGSLRIALLAFPFAQALLLGSAWAAAQKHAAEAIIEG